MTAPSIARRYEMCDGGWDFFLRRSLRQLIETGVGLPVLPEHRRQ